MCNALGCACWGPIGPLPSVVVQSHARFGALAPVSSRTAVGSFIDRFHWPHPISHDWPTAEPQHLAFPGRGTGNGHRWQQDINIEESLAQRLAFFNASTMASTTSDATMQFSGKDLEDIQRVAGLLNLTVDELLQRRRTRSHDTATNSPLQQPVLGGLHRGYSPLQWENGASTGQQLAYRDLGSDTVDLGDFESSGSGLESPDFLLPSPVLVGQDRTTEVFLLNPQTTRYDCDVPLSGFDQPAGGSFAFDRTTADPEADGEEPHDSAVRMDIDSGSHVSDHTVQEQGDGCLLDDVSTDWALVSASPESSVCLTPISASTSSANKRFYKIAPRLSKSSSQSASESGSHRVKKKRSPYEGSKRIDTHLTRQLHACVRCRMQRNRCIPDPTNPRGPCLTCQQRTVRMSRLPCLRYMVTDSTLFRTGLDYMPFYRDHPMVGPHYGDFHLERQWLDVPSKFLCLGQVGSLHFKVELKRFVPPAHSRDVDLKGRSMYAVPWAIADPEAAVEAITEYIDRAKRSYLAAYLDDTDPLVWNIFEAAYRASVFPVPNEMLQKTLRLWVACRFIESKWRCWAESGWADSEIREANPQDPFYRDLDSLPPYIDYQLASIIIHRILGPLRKDVLRELQSTFNTHSPKDWFATFLTSFILLQNYEMQMLFQRQFAARRRARVQYLDMPLVRATNSGAKTILAHFHYCYKGQQLFSPGFDWNSPRVRRMARLDLEQTQFMAQCRDVVVKKARIFHSINNSDVYHEQWWYTSQLFDPDWTPRDTLEHAPPAEANVLEVA